MVGEQDAWQHDIHNRCMVGNNHIRLCSVNLLLGFADKLVAEAHAVEHPYRPKADKKVAVAVILLADRKDVNR